MIRTLATLAAVLALALAGCGGDDEPSDSGGGATSTPTPAAASGDGGGGGGGGGEQLALAAPEDGSLSFDKTELEAKEGQVTIEFDNPSSTPHAVAIEGEDVDETSETVTAGKASVSTDLAAGEYTFYCPVGNHRAGGMEGTLTVG